MTTQVPGKAKNKLSVPPICGIKELGGEIISIAPDKPQAAKKAHLLNEIKEGLKEVKEIREGKSKSYSMSDLFDGK